MMKDGPNSQAVIHSLSDALYQMMISWSLTGTRNPAVERFQKTLLDNLSNDEFDLTAEVESSGYSQSYFRKLFKRSTGHSPLGYLNRMRIEYAKHQIQQYFGARLMKDIALNSGFSDPYYFSRVFHQFEGVSPTEYGKKLAEVKVQKAEYTPPSTAV
jgi:AraC-like DNA-binding protein